MHLYQSPLIIETPFNTILNFIIGIIIGSFLAVLFDRFSTQDSSFAPHSFLWILSQPSKCPHCSKRLRFLEMIPVFSFIQLKGRCRYCHTHYGYHSFLMELACGFVSSAVFGYYGMSLESVGILYFIFLALTTALIDFKTRRLYDCLVYLLLWSGLLYSLISPFVHCWQAIIGAISSWLVLELLRQFYIWRKRIAIGRGDLKFAAALSTWIGIQNLPTFFLCASIIGLTLFCIGKRFSSLLIIDEHQSIAFGMPLALSAVLLLFIECL